MMTLTGHGHGSGQVLSFDDCLEKIENAGNTVRVQGALDLLRELETEKHAPKPTGEEYYELVDEFIQVSR